MIATPDFNKAPFLVIWETTRACGLACRHCRANAVTQRDPDELTFDQACGMLDDVRAMGTPIVVFSGGDPLMREDLDDLIRYAVTIGLRAGTIPAATEKLTRERIAALHAVGLHQMALSLDGYTADLHDTFRGVPGSFDRTLQAASWARELGQPLQINSVVTRENADNFHHLADLVQSLGIVFWEVFFLVRMGRGEGLEECTEEQQRRIFEQLAGIQKQKKFIVKVTEAPQYRRYLSENHAGAGRPMTDGTRPLAVSRAGVNSGKGFCFVDHHGEVFPSGFLPLSAGSVKDAKLSDLYRTSDLFRTLRDPDQLGGICGTCGYRRQCGGSRARAFFHSGDMMAEDPSCFLEPGGPSCV